MDRRTLAAVALCLVLFLAYPFLLKLLGLDQYLRPPARPQGQRPPATAPETLSAGREAAPESLRATESPYAPAGTTATTASTSERLITVDTPLYRAWFSTGGARLLGVELKQYAAAHRADEAKHTTHKPGRLVPEGERVTLDGRPSFGMDLGSGPSAMPLDDVTFEAAESLDAAGSIRAITFRVRLPEGASIRQTYRLRPDDYAIDFETEIRGVPPSTRLADYSLIARSWPLAHENDQEDEARSLRASALVGTNLHREGEGGLRRGPKLFEGNAAWVAVQTRYFVGAIAIAEGSAKSAATALQSRAITAEERKRLGPDAKPVQDRVTSTLVVSLPGETDPVDRYVLYFGPSEYFRLSRLGHGLERVVDLGWNWIRPFSKLLLQVMVWLYRVLANYGLAIIVLATLVRVLLHPLSMMSIKSMRAMQRVQPEMERIREKYKSDPQAMNTAMMALYREHKINPAGGCLPMVVQMPLFIALYSVLYNAIELRQAPFVGWMNDLSAPDLLLRVGSFPIRLLPLIMAGSGILQQRMTPTDPRQATSMYMMNVIMVVFFYNLPSGLVLYWTVMNVLTALQQWIALHEDRGAPAAAAASKVAVRAGPK